MAMTTKTVMIGSEWTAVTNKVALLQFNDDMTMALGTATAPNDPVGFSMSRNEKYVNAADGIVIWAKAKAGGTGTESVRVAEDS